MSGMFGTHKSARCCTLRLYDVSVFARATLSSEKRSDIWDHFVWELIWDFLVSSWHNEVHSFSMCFIVFAFAMVWRYHWSLHFFPVCWASPSVFLWISMCICGALQSSTVYLCAGGCERPCLGGWLDKKLPGWARQRGQCWHLSDEIRCPGCPPVDAPARWWELGRCLRPSGGRGATSFSNLFHGGKKWKSFRSSFEVHVPSHVEYHHNLNESICWVHLQGRYMSISRICWKFNRCLLTSLDQIRNKPG